MIIKTKMRINIFLLTPFLIILLIACTNQQTEQDLIQMDDDSVLISMDNVPFSTVNMTDEKGLKQGLWQEDDQEEGELVYSITKEYNYKNDTLHGYYLEYKTKSDDTLIYGHFFEGKKDGEWKYWATDRNEIEKVEVYKNDKLIK